jgi:hypothetical protein
MNKAICGLCAGLFAMAASAEPGPATTPDYCDDPSGWQSMEGLLQSAPNDELVIKMYALRIGLCQLIKDKKINAQAGINLFEMELDRAIDRRALEEQKSDNYSAHSL